MKIDKDQVLEKMQRGEVVVLNVLPKIKYNKLHIKGSENLPLGESPEAFCKEAVATFGKGKVFVVYGDRFGLLDSYMAVQALESGGQKALNYSGGLQEWHKSGLPVGGTQVDVEPAVSP